MTDKHFKKGLITGIIAIFIVGIAPVIANSRPLRRKGTTLIHGENKLYNR